MKKTYHGSCHCEAVRFECDIDLSQGTTRCNCRFCTKARFWFAIVKADALRVLQGAELLKDYQRAPTSRPQPYLHFLFCSRCGVRSFTKGGTPEAGDEFYAVNLGCLDDATDKELAEAPITFRDGRHDDWAKAPEEHRFL